MKKWLVIILGILLITGCDSGEQKDRRATTHLKKVTIALEWSPNTNHTGLYVAEKLGYFKKQGLDVNILPPGKVNADQLVASGKATFGVGLQENITQARTKGVPLVSIAAIIQHNTSGFASLANKQITSPKDFEGKTYGGWGAPVEKAVISSLMKQDKADISKVKIVNAGDADFFTIMKKDIDFAWIYYGWTGAEAERRGIDLNMVYLTDYSKKLDYYTPVLETNEKMIKQDPETVKQFVHAVSEGYDYAIKHPQEAADILTKAVPSLDKALVLKSQEWLSPRYQADSPRWGEQKLSVWKNYADWMTAHGLLEGDFKPEKAYTNQFLPDKGEE
ncbi:ABC transporter substrate-binding protein [Camelliibacillus cellulosilyticus]|uniref:ABC transporter substrate-binding protein n=1 Tax=Camelliibacillus cellulosilyticus TaxID=2174486 RepID=A0ABV9GJC4_9BACL